MVRPGEFIDDDDFAPRTMYSTSRLYERYGRAARHSDDAIRRMLAEVVQALGLLQQARPAASAADALVTGFRDVHLLGLLLQ